MRLTPLTDGVWETLKRALDNSFRAYGERGELSQDAKG